MLHCTCYQKPSSKETMQGNKTLHGSRRRTKYWRSQAATREKSSSPRNNAGQQATLWLMMPGDQCWRTQTQVVGHVKIVATGSTSTMTPASQARLFQQDVSMVLRMK